MSEITKLYENAGIKAKEYCDRDSDTCMTCCPEWENRQNCWKYKSVMPPFTAEKVLKVIVFFLNKGIRLDFSVEENIKISVENFKECIAQIGAKYWQDLSEEEKQQVKGILE